MSTSTLAAAAVAAARESSYDTATSTTTRCGGGDGSYEEIEKLIKMGLGRARKALDTKLLIDGTYDSGNFGIDGSSSGSNDDDDNDAKETNIYLATVMNDMLDKINMSVLEDMMEQVDHHDNNKDKEEQQEQNQRRQKKNFIDILLKVRNRLHWVDELTDKLISREQQLASKEKHDKETASKAIKTTLLPNNGITMDDVLRHKQYHELLCNKLELQKQISITKSNIADLEKEQSSKTQLVKTNLQQIQSISKKLSTTADTCSTNVTTTAVGVALEPTTAAAAMEVDDTEMKNADKNNDVEEVVINQNDDKKTKGNNVNENNDSSMRSSTSTTTTDTEPALLSS